MKRMPRQLLTLLLLYLVSCPVLFGTVDRMIFLFSDTQLQDWVNVRYSDHPLTTAVHLIPGFLMLCVAPLQISDTLRRRYRAFHRFLGRVFCISGIVSGVGVLWMVIVFPALGGVLTQVVTFVLVFSMCAFMGIAVKAIRSRRTARHRDFMMRAYAIALSVSTARIFIELAELFFGLPFEASFVIASAAGVIVNSGIAEWIIYQRKRTAEPIQRVPA